MPAPGEPPGSRATRDLQLVQRTLRGDLAATEEFLQRMTCIRRFLGARNAALGNPLGSHEFEDTLQTILLAVWQKRERFLGYGELEAWACRFSYLELLNQLQKQRRLPGRLEEAVERDGEDPAALPGSDPFEYEPLYRALEQLESGEAELVRAKHLAALTFEEIAERGGLSPNTVKTRYYRALEKLRVMLAQRDDLRVAGGTT